MRAQGHVNRRSARTFLRYVVLQVPGWVLLLGLLLFLRSWIGQPAWWVSAAILSGWVAKDLLLYPFLHRAYEVEPFLTGAERLVGAHGVVTAALAPQGYVRVRGELWRAEARTAEPVPEGSTVRISAARGFILAVERDV